MLEFLPDDLTVPVDTPVTWSWAETIEPHSVTFVPEGTDPPNELMLDEYLAPIPPTGSYDGTTVANSGLLPLGPGEVPPFEVTFGETGDFTYCGVIHPNMASRIVAR